jgi:hypothetical protein
MQAAELATNALSLFAICSSDSPIYYHPILDLFPIRVYPRKSAVSFFVFSDAGDHPVPSASSVPLCFKGFCFPDLLRVSAPLR